MLWNLWLHLTLTIGRLRWPLVCWSATQKSLGFSPASADGYDSVSGTRVSVVVSGKIITAAGTGSSTTTTYLGPGSCVNTLFSTGSATDIGPNIVAITKSTGSSCSDGKRSTSSCMRADCLASVTAINGQTKDQQSWEPPRTKSPEQRRGRSRSRQHQPSPQGD